MTEKMKPCNCWRKGNTLPRGAAPPRTVEQLQMAWDRDQELMFEQKAEIEKLKQKVNQLQQRHITRDMLPPELVREIQAEALEAYSIMMVMEMDSMYLLEKAVQLRGEGE